jgi:hypothetical protein
VLEQRYGQKVTAVRTGSFGRAELDRYNVIVMPSDNYTGALDDAAVQRLRRWVQDGGTLITMAESSVWAARENVGLLGTRTEQRQRTVTQRATSQPIDLLDAITPEREAPDPVPGAILHAALTAPAALP